MPETMNGRPRKTYVCEDHYVKRADGSGTDFVKGCGFEFKTCGNPQTCPRCHAQLPIDESQTKKRKK